VVRVESITDVGDSSKTKRSKDGTRKPDIEIPAKRRSRPGLWALSIQPGP